MNTCDLNTRNVDNWSIDVGDIVDDPRYNGFELPNIPTIQKLRHQLGESAGLSAYLPYLTVDERKWTVTNVSQFPNYSLTEPQKHCVEKAQLGIDMLAGSFPKVDPKAVLAKMFSAAPKVASDDFVQNTNSSGEGTEKPYYCNECGTWHLGRITTTVGRNKSQRWMKEVWSGGKDGQKEFLVWDEKRGDDEAGFANAARNFAFRDRDVKVSWAKYWVECAITGNDPLEQATQKISKEKWCDWCLAKVAQIGVVSRQSAAKN